MQQHRTDPTHPPRAAHGLAGRGCKTAGWPAVCSTFHCPSTVRPLSVQDCPSAISHCAFAAVKTLSVTAFHRGPPCVRRSGPSALLTKAALLCLFVGTPAAFATHRWRVAAVRCFLPAQPTVPCCPVQNARRNYCMCMSCMCVLSCVVAVCSCSCVSFCVCVRLCVLRVVYCVGALSFGRAPTPECDRRPKPCSSSVPPSVLSYLLSSPLAPPLPPCSFSDGFNRGRRCGGQWVGLPSRRAEARGRGGAVLPLPDCTHTIN